MDGFESRQPSSNGEPIRRPAHGIRDEPLRAMLEDMIRKVNLDNPAKGRWDVAGNEATVWVDASSIALGVVLEVGGHVMEDASWLRPEDASHINLAELDVVIKGVNVALVWKLKTLHVRTDSLTVYHWIPDALSGKARLRTKAFSEMLIRRRVETLMALRDGYRTCAIRKQSGGCSDTRASEMARKAA